jgi:hypothetical protein
MAKLKQLGVELVDEYKDVFAPIPHINKLSTDVYCTILTLGLSHVPRLCKLNL